MTRGDQTAGSERSEWFFRPVILFATAYIIVAVIHESAPAVTAYTCSEFKEPLG